MKEKKLDKKKTKRKLIPPDLSTFGFIAHPLSIAQVTQKYKIADKVPPQILAGVLKRRRAVVYPDIKGIQSDFDGRKALGWFVIVPLLPWQFTDLDESYVVDKIIKACKRAQKQGAKIVGLGAYTAIVGQGGRMIADNIDIAVTTGNTYTTTLAIEGALKASEMMEINLKNSVVAVVGATGSIGSACAKILGPQSGEIHIIGRNEFVLDELKESLKKNANPVIYKSISEGIKEADVVLTVTGATNEIIYPPDIKSGAVVCDVARPRDVSELVSRVRKDVLVIDGAIVEVPGNNVKFGLNFGPPPGMAEGCVAETIILALEKRYENYTIGKDITENMVTEMGELAKKHGFKIAGFRRFEKLMDEKEVEKVKHAIKKR